MIKASPDRTTLSLAAPNRTNDSLQSGLFDEQILCAKCDGILGIPNDSWTIPAVLFLIRDERPIQDSGEIPEG